MSIAKLRAAATRPGTRSKVFDLKSLGGDPLKIGPMFGKVFDLQEKGFRFYLVGVKHPKK